MPIYEYKCTECGHQLEAIQKVSDDPLKDCPECNKAALKRLLSAAGFQLKGSGWYATDFKNKGQKPQGQGKGDSKESASSSSSEAGGEAAPAKKAHSCGGGACGCA